MKFIVRDMRYSLHRACEFEEICALVDQHRHLYSLSSADCSDMMCDDWIDLFSLY